MSDFRLSKQEEQVLLQSMSGLGDKEVADVMGLSTETVRTYWKRIRSKIGGASRAEVIALLARRDAEEALRATQSEKEHLTREMERRERAQASLRERERRYRWAFETNPAAIFVLDSKGLVVDANPSAARSVGCSRDQLLGDNIERIRARLNGRLVLEPRAHEDADLGIALAFGNSTGSSYRSVFHLTTSPLALISSGSLQIVDANEAFSGVYGYALADLIGQSVELLVPQAMKGPLLNALQRDGAPSLVQEHTRRTGERVPVEVRLRGIEDAGAPLHLMEVRPIVPSDS